MWIITPSLAHTNLIYPNFQKIVGALVEKTLYYWFNDRKTIFVREMKKLPAMCKDKKLWFPN
jgi:hypothetical protein